MKQDLVDTSRSLQARRPAAGRGRIPANLQPRAIGECGCAAMAVLGLVAGCALGQPPGTVRVTYDCDDGRGFAALYERDGQVILELDEEERVLPEVAALAGTRYDDGTYELRLEGRAATLRGTAATYSNCIARDWQKVEPH